MRLECIVKYKINSGLSWPAVAKKYGVTLNKLTAKGASMRKQGLIPKLRKGTKNMNKDDYNVYNQAKAIIKNNWSLEEASGNLNVTSGGLRTSMYVTLERHFPELHTLVKRVFSKHAHYNEKYYNLALQTMKDLRKGIKVSRSEFKSDNKFQNKDIISFLKLLNINYPAINIRINKMFKESANPKYEQIAKYMIETKCNYEQAGKYFGITGATVRIHIGVSLRKNNPELFEQFQLRKYVD
jgi:hypothetical protein